MNCSNCGRTNRAAALYCAHCGKPLQSAPAGPGEEWEYCQVEADWRKKGSPPFESYECWFWAKATNNQAGIYNAGKSVVYKIAGYNLVWQPFANPPTGNSDDDRNRSALAHEQLVKKLLAEGWKLTGEQGSKWWQLRFKRKT